MARGHKTGGRRKGTPNKKTAARRDALLAAQTAGLSPLDYLLSVMRDSKEPKEFRIEAAKAAAPFVHARFLAVSVPPPDRFDEPNYERSVDHDLARRIAFTLGSVPRAREKAVDDAKIIEFQSKAA